MERKGDKWRREWEAKESGKGLAQEQG